MKTSIKLIFLTFFLFLLSGCNNDSILLKVEGLSGYIEVTEIDSGEVYTLEESSGYVAINTSGPRVSFEITHAPLLKHCEFSSNRLTAIHEVKRDTTLIVQCFDKVLFAADSHNGEGRRVYATDASSQNTEIVTIEDSNTQPYEAFRGYGGSPYYYGKPDYIGNRSSISSATIKDIDGFQVYLDINGYWRALTPNNDSVFLDNFPYTAEILPTSAGLYSLRNIPGGNAQIWKYQSLLSEPTMLVELPKGEYHDLHFTGNKLIVMDRLQYLVEVSDNSVITMPLAGDILFASPSSDKIVYFSDADRRYNGENIDYSIFMSTGSISNVNRIHSPVEDIGLPEVFGELSGKLIFGISYRKDDQLCQGIFIEENYQLKQYRSICDGSWAEPEIINNELRLTTKIDVDDGKQTIYFTYISDLIKDKSRTIKGPTVYSDEHLIELIEVNGRYFLTTYRYEDSMPMAPIYFTQMTRVRSYSKDTKQWTLLVETPSFCWQSCEMDLPVKSLGHVNDMWVFMLFTEEYGREPWITDGTLEGTQILKDIDPIGGSMEIFSYYNRR